MRKDISPIIAFFIMLAAVAVSALLLHPAELRYGHDIFYHVLRTEALYDQLSRGVPAHPINYFFFNGAGYPSTLCYPDLLLYIPAALRFCGLNPGQATTLFILLCSAASCGTAYWAASEITGSRRAAVCAAVVYTLCQYRLDCMYTRGALGEIQAFIFIPLAMYAVYDLIFRDFRRPFLMVAAFSGLMLTHTVSLFAAVVIAAVFCLIFIRRVLRHIPAAAGAALLTLGLTAFFWIPCCEMLLVHKMKASVPWTSAAENAVPLLTLFSNTVLGQAKAGMGIAVFALCLMCPVLFFRRGGSGESDEGTYPADVQQAGRVHLAAGLLCALSATVLFPWAYAGFLGIIQFPWRLYSFASWFLAAAAGAMIECLYVKYGMQNRFPQFMRHLPVFGVLALMCASALWHYSVMEGRYYDVPDSFYADPVKTMNVCRGEWLPLNTDWEKLVSDDYLCRDENGRALECKSSKDRLRMFIPLNGDDLHSIEVPRIWYPGYIAVHITAYKKPSLLPVTGDGRNGFCRIAVEPGLDGFISLRYAKTLPQRAAVWITWASLLSVAVFAVWRRRRMKNS